MINQNNMFIAEVRNVKDDLSKSGKVQIRIYGNHDDEQNIKDDDLPWGTVILPVTSKFPNVPTVVRLDVTILDASVLPVRFPAFAVIYVLLAFVN